MHKQSSYQNSFCFLNLLKKIKNINIYFNSVIQNYLHLIKKISYKFRTNKKIEIFFLVMILPFDTRKVPHFLIFSKVLSIL